MIQIDLSGPQGDAFYILGVVDKALKEKDCTQEQRDAYEQEAITSSYEYLLEVTIETLNKYGIKHDLYYGETAMGHE